MTLLPTVAPLCWSLAALALLGSRAGAAEADAGFKDRVLPVLAKHCHECHSHAAKKSKNGLVLDSVAAIVTGGEAGPAIVPGQPEQSLLLKAVRHLSPNLQMPPKGKAKLTEAEITVLAEWVKQLQPLKEPAVRAGLDWWSLQPLVRPTVPSIANRQSAIGNPIDAFIAAKLREQKLAPSPEADARTLIRRLHFDLLGLPPSPEEVEGFERDFSLSPSPTFSPAPKAGETVGKWESGHRALDALVEKLLASPHHGERWARHWLDTIHFADTHGFEHDIFRTNAWRYRDYVITAFNRDVPWSRFIREQLAAEVFYPAEPQLMAALGFLGAGPLDTSTQSTAPRTFDYLDRDDLVTQTMSAFASTTAHCARCHAHKFDPHPAGRLLRAASCVCRHHEGRSAVRCSGRDGAAAAALAVAPRRCGGEGRDDAANGGARGAHRALGGNAGQGGDGVAAAGAGELRVVRRLNVEAGGRRLGVGGRHATGAGYLHGHRTSTRLRYGGGDGGR